MSIWGDGHFLAASPFCTYKKKQVVSSTASQGIILEIRVPFSYTEKAASIVTSFTVNMAQ